MHKILQSVVVIVSLLTAPSAGRADEPLPILDLPGAARNPERIDYSALPTITG